MIRQNIWTKITLMSWTSWKRSWMSNLECLVSMRTVRRIPMPIIALFVRRASKLRKFFFKSFKCNAHNLENLLPTIRRLTSTERQSKHLKSLWPRTKICWMEKKKRIKKPKLTTKKNHRDQHKEIKVTHFKRFSAHPNSSSWMWGVFRIEIVYVVQVLYAFFLGGCVPWTVLLRRKPKSGRKCLQFLRDPEGLIFE